MFEVYAAGIEYRLAAEQRERALRHRALRAARADRESELRVGRIRSAIRAWPRPIALHTAPMTHGLVAHV
jgi:hypothetical protein